MTRKQHRYDVAILSHGDNEICDIDPTKLSHWVLNKSIKSTRNKLTMRTRIKVAMRTLIKVAMRTRIKVPMRIRIKVALRTL